MSDAKAKALELHTKMLCVKDGSHKYPMCFDSAKQCALICVEEILKANGNENEYVYNGIFYSLDTFFEEVKEEINKL